MNPTIEQIARSHSFTLDERDRILAALTEATACLAQAEQDTKLYHELLYAVASKFPNETRHQTALRYIKRAEELKFMDDVTNFVHPDSAMKETKP
jgi:hypothetical protein